MPRLVLLLILGLSTCVRAGAGEEIAEISGMDPKALAERFFEAQEAQDEAAFAELMSPKANLGRRSGAGYQLPSGQLKGWTVLAADILGDDAFVPVVAVIRGQAEDIDVLLRRSEGRWFIYGLRIFLTEVGELVVDFEELGRLAQAGAPAALNPDDTRGLEPAEDADSDVDGADAPQDSRRQRAAFEAIASMSLRKHENHWRFNLVARGRSAHEVVREIIEPAGLVLDPRGALAALEKRVHMTAKGISRVDALERVAAAVGLVPVYPEPTFTETPPALSFEPGPRDWPAAWAGPFLIEIEDLEEHVPLATGRVTLGIRSLGVSPSVLGFQTRMFEHLAITKVIDARGRNLHAEEGVSFPALPRIQGAYWSDRVTLELSGLLRSVKHIRSIDGRLTLRLPTAVERFVWPVERVNKRKFFGARTLELVEWGTTTRFAFKAHPDQIAVTEIRFSPLGEQGAPLGTLFADSFGLGNVLMAMLQSPQVPQKIDVKLCRVEEVSVPFSIEKIPLQRHADMPPALEELRFDGPSPVAAEFVRFRRRGGDVPEIEMRFLNTSNKDVMRLAADYLYLDRHGLELGSFPHTLFGARDFEFTGPGALVTRGMTIEHNSSAFFMPEETVKVRIEVTAIEFSDASAWRR